MFVAALYLFPIIENLPWVLLGWILFGKIGGEIGFHRYLCHKSFETGILRHHLLMVLGCMNCFGSPISWAAIHRSHHVHSDTDLDPHGGALPPWRVWFTLWKIQSIGPRVVLNEMKDPKIRWYHHNYFFLVIGLYGIFALFSLQFAAFFVSVPAVLTFHSAGLVNFVCHNWGYRNHRTKDSSFNNLFVNALTLGSGLHNNHHNRPNSPYCSENWFEFDLPGFLIRTIFNSRNRHVA